MFQKLKVSDLLTHGKIDKGKNVVLDQDGEAQEDGVQQEHVHAQLYVQLPLVNMDPQDLCRKISYNVHKYGAAHSDVSL